MELMPVGNPDMTGARNASADPDPETGRCERPTLRWLGAFGLPAARKDDLISHQFENAGSYTPGMSVLLWPEQRTY